MIRIRNYLRNQVVIKVLMIVIANLHLLISSYLGEDYFRIVIAKVKVIKTN